MQNSRANFRTYAKMPIFLHIFKAAGTSVDAQLRAASPNGTHQRINDGQNVGGKSFIERVKTAHKASDVKSFSGHFRAARLMQALGPDLSSCCVFSFVRHPIRRLISSYGYWKRIPGSSQHTLVNELDLGAFFEYALEQDFDFARNYQCRVLSANNTPSFEAARETIEKSFAFVGLAEYLAASNRAAHDTLGIRFDESIVHNAAPQKTLVPVFSPDMEERLVHENEQDFRLYRWIEKRVYDGSGGSVHNVKVGFVPERSK